MMCPHLLYPLWEPKRKKCAADTPTEASTYGFGLVRGLDLFAFKFLPVNIPEKCMFLDVSFTFGATT